ncbi:LuxR C-terminal-related transcriptional regulator [Polaromonas sp.]|uniref:LuxR C-terminal-related transcriptional regulator n=1 Tax=Polaromonas sp. TaxID=1869339 RepID=UPI003266DCB7
MNSLQNLPVEDHAQFHPGMHGVCAPPPSSGAGDEPPKPALTARQCEVLTLLCEGMSDKLIARRLDLSHHTVRGHIQIVFARLQVSTRMQAMFAARRLGLFD